MKAATVLPTRKIVPDGIGSLVQPLRGYADVFSCILWFNGTAWLRLLPIQPDGEAPSHNECLLDINENPGRWVCIANNR